MQCVMQSMHNAALALARISRGEFPDLPHRAFQAWLWLITGAHTITVLLLRPWLPRWRPMNVPIPMRRVFLTACCVGAFLIVVSIDDGGERGWLTGPLLNLVDFSSLLFLAAAVSVWIRFRFAAALALAASVMSWPWWLYAIYPNAYKPVYLIYKSINSQVMWSKSPLPVPFSFSPQFWLRVLFLLFVPALSIYSLRSKTASPTKHA